jgi:hypothetical protein
MIFAPFLAGLLRGPACLLLLVTLAIPSFAGPINLGTWYEFGFTTPGVLATGCDPNDPSGPFCPPSSGTPVTALTAPPWTFSSTLPTLLTVTDAFLSGDQFQVFDLTTSLGNTSVPTPGIDCGDDPVPCLATTGVSSRVFPLAAGSHSLTIRPTIADFGSAYLRVDTAVPEPAMMLPVAAGLLFCCETARRMRRRRLL